ncbi:OmpA family protein [bacterium]|nr:OmpA family protein [bacterium]
MFRFSRFGLFVFFCAFCGMYVCDVHAESGTFYGTVRDADDVLPSAFVYDASCKGNLLAQADADGNFSVSNRTKGENLCVHMQTYSDKIITISDFGSASSPVEVVLELDNDNKLDEVTAVGCTVDKSKGQAYLERDEKGKCVVKKCLDGWDLKSGNCVKQKESNIGKPCTVSNGSGEYQEVDGKEKCVVTECNDGYAPNKDNTKCDKITKCSAAADKAVKDKDANIESTKLDGGKCVVASCKKGYKPNDARDGCTQTKGDCTPDDKNASAGEMKKGKCVITVCKEGYHPSKDGSKCEGAGLTKEQSQARVDELKENAKKMKEKEQSLENRMLGAAAMGTMGKSGADLASGMAEKNADEAAERDMKAYLATFTCEYGGGKRVAGGESNVELPGGNDLFALANEYKSLALDLKERKNALGLRAGIESQEIIDPADSGLYDNVGIGRQGGAFTSLSRALTDSNSEDAKAWAQQKADTASKIKTAGTTLAVAAVGSMAANLALNNKDSKKNKADEINKKYRDMMTQPLADLESDVKKAPESNPVSCGGGSTGTWPNCICSGTNAVYNANSNACDVCDSDRIADKTNNVCQKNCVNGTYDADRDVCSCNQGWRGDLCNDEIKNNVNGKPQINVPQCIDNKKLINGVCACEKGFGGPKCDCDLSTHVYSGDKCTPKTTASDLKAVLPAKNLFENNSFELTSGAKEALSKFAKDVGKMVSENVGMAYCVHVVGHTDKTGGKSYNKTLSEKRANAVKEYLVSRNVSLDHITSEGRGWDECTTNGKDDNCRRVDITSEDKNCDGSGGTSGSTVQSDILQITTGGIASSTTATTSANQSITDTPAPLSEAQIQKVMTKFVNACSSYNQGGVRGYFVVDDSV